MVMTKQNVMRQSAIRLAREAANEEEHAVEAVLDVAGVQQEAEVVGQGERLPMLH